MKGKVFGLVLVCMALALAAGCAGQTTTAAGMSEVLINASPEEVWDWMCAGNASDPGMNPLLKEVKNQRGEYCTVGYSEEHIYKALGVTNEVKVVATEISLHERAVFKTVGDFSSTATYLVVPEGNSTRLILVMEITGKLPPGITSDVASKEIQGGFDKMLKNIKEKVEK